MAAVGARIAQHAQEKGAENINPMIAAMMGLKKEAGGGVATMRAVIRRDGKLVVDEMAAPTPAPGQLLAQEPGLRHLRVGPARSSTTTTT